MGITKKERRVMELSATLPAIRKTDIKWIADNYKKNYKNKGLSSYYLILERCQDYQVIRYYYKTRKRLFEFMQIWFNKEDNIVLAKNRFMRVDGWQEDSEMRPKKWFRQYIEYSYLGGVGRIPWCGCKIRSLLPELKQRGLKTSIHGIHPYYLCRALLDNNRIETLFKLRQYLVVDEFAWGNKHLTDDIWQSIRVALRHGYHWDNHQEFTDWYDMIDDLKELGKDTRNPHYICPTNLEKAHQKYIEQSRRKQELEQWANEIKSAEAYEPFFKATREQFFDLVLTDGEITINVIKSALGIKEEGRAMHHCVGGYYNKPKSLILSAKVDGNRVETIEVNLDSYKLIQSRGLCNRSTEYHQRIVDLINANLDTIRVLNVTHKDTEKKEINKLKIAV